MTTFVSQQPHGVFACFETKGHGIDWLSLQPPISAQSAQISDMRCVLRAVDVKEAAGSDWTLGRETDLQMLSPSSLICLCCQLSSPCASSPPLLSQPQNRQPSTALTTHPMPVSQSSGCRSIHSRSNVGVVEPPTTSSCSLSLAARPC